MLTLITVAHLVIGISLVLFVLLQDPKGGAMGVFSGGSSANSFFGASGASNFLTTTTRWLAILFAISSLGLTYLTAKRGASVMDDLPGATSTVPEQQSPRTRRRLINNRSRALTPHYLRAKIRLSRKKRRLSNPKRCEG